MKVDLVVRFFNEHIYAEHFINYYLGIGFDHIHVLFQNNQEPYNIHNSHVSIIRHPYFGNDVIDHVSPLVNTTADWIFLCDADEYLYLKEYKSIKDFLSTVPLDVTQVFFQWAMIENFADMSGNKDVFDILSTHNIYINSHIKSMIHVKCFKASKIHPHHSVVSNKNYLWNSYVDNKPLQSFNTTNYIDTTYPFILHYHTRSLKNAFIKGLSTHLIHSGKKIDCSKFIQMIVDRNINEIVKLTKIRLPFAHSKNPILQIKIHLNGSLINYDNENKQLQDLCTTHGINHEALLEIIKLLDEKYSSHFRLCD